MQSTCAHVAHCKHTHKRYLQEKEKMMTQVWGFSPASIAWWGISGLWQCLSTHRPCGDFSPAAQCVTASERLSGTLPSYQPPSWATCDQRDELLLHSTGAYKEGLFTRLRIMFTQVPASPCREPYTQSPFQKLLGSFLEYLAMSVVHEAPACQWKDSILL